MLHFGSFEIETDIFIYIVAAVILLVQLLLCFKVKNRHIRLIPVYLFSVLTAVFAALSFAFDHWDRVGFVVLAVCAAFFLLVCGAAWAIWRFIKRRRESNKP
ncbi:MAG: hypothetical protein E7633_07835 [Ruminococcaceae bacterium]|nr:hypothetical protein [Oscillospiraceae bacterium]